MNNEDVGASVLVTFVGSDEDELDQKLIRLGKIAEDAGALDVLVVATTSTKKAAWSARSSFLTAIEADTKLIDEMDVVVPVDKIPAFLIYIRKLGAKRAVSASAISAMPATEICTSTAALMIWKKRNSRNGSRSSWTKLIPNVRSWKARFQVSIPSDTPKWCI